MVLHLLLLFFILMVVSVFLTRYPKLSLAIVIIVVVFLNSTWLKVINDQFSIFTLVKLYTLLFCLIVVLRSFYAKWPGEQFMVKFFYILLILNIMEATFKDYVQYNWLGLQNGVAGIILCYTLRNWRFISITGEKNKRLSWNMSLNWIIGYTLWNLSFVSNNYPEGMLRHVVVLSLPLLAMFWDRKIWCQIRLFSLSAYFFVYFFNRRFWDVTDVSSLTPLGKQILVGLTLLWALRLLCVKWFERYRTS